MKPILEWYEQLPEPIRSQAIANYDGRKVSSSTLSQAIMRGFIWAETEEGFGYWEKTHGKAKDGQYNNHYPTLAQSLNQLEATLNEINQALEEVRKAIRK